MDAHALAHPHGPAAGDVPQDAFGTASTGKIAMWLFLLADAFSFSGLLLGYGILRAGRDDWPVPSEHLGINLTAVLTFWLICSSVTMVMAVSAAHEGDRAGTLKWLGLTVLGGVGFLGGQAYEYTHLINHGITFNQCLPEGATAYCPPQFASTFFMITGFHGLHVLTGTIYNFVVLANTARGKFTGAENHNQVEIAGLFWHFVDLVWILVFTFVYLV